MGVNRATRLVGFSEDDFTLGIDRIMGHEDWKRLAVSLSVVWLIALPLAAYVEYERARAESDVLQFAHADPQTYRLKSSFWLFDRYTKIVLSDDEVGLGKLPAPEVNDLLILSVPKFFLLWLIPLAAIWLLAFVVSWARRPDAN